MSDKKFINPVSHRHAVEKRTKTFLFSASPRRKTGVALLICSLAFPHFLTFCGYPLHYVTLTLLFCQGVGLAFVTAKFRLWLPLTAMLLLCGWYWPVPVHLVDVCSLYALALTAPFIAFLRSLLPNQEPLITKFARQVHGALRPDIVCYTYWLTWFWSLFFLAALLSPLLLWVYGSPNAWQWPLNGGTLALAAIFLLLEYGIRRMIIRNFDHASLRTSIGTFLRQS